MSLGRINSTISVNISSFSREKTEYVYFQNQSANWTTNKSKILSVCLKNDRKSTFKFLVIND